jgi:hypothetical protein
MAAVIRLDLSAAAPTMARMRPRIAPADEPRLGAAAPLNERQVAIDELVVVDRHGPMVDGHRDS